MLLRSVDLPFAAILTLTEKVGPELALAAETLATVSETLLSLTVRALYAPSFRVLGTYRLSWRRGLTSWRKSCTAKK